MRNKIFRRGLYVTTILAMISIIIVAIFLPKLIKWYGDNILKKQIHGSVAIFLYFTLIPFIIIIFEVMKLSKSLMIGNCFNLKCLSRLKIITICSLIDFIIYFIGTAFIYRTLICLVVMIATLMVFIISSVIMELISSGIILKDENDLTI